MGFAAPLRRRGARFMALNKLSFQTFSSQLNSVFQVTLEDGTSVPLILKEATKRTARKSEGPQAKAYERFSLVFIGPWDQVLEQRIHSFQHPRIGNFEIFIVPVISRDTSGAHYECIFNRPLVKHSATA
jgi:hypothetical protein